MSYSAFMEAIYYGHMEIVKYLLKVDEEVNGTSKLLFHRDTKYNLLHAVAGCKMKTDGNCYIFAKLCNGK